MALDLTRRGRPIEVNLVEAFTEAAIRCEQRRLRWRGLEFDHGNEMLIANNLTSQRALTVLRVRCTSISMPAVNASSPLTCHNTRKLPVRFSYPCCHSKAPTTVRQRQIARSNRRQMCSHSQLVMRQSQHQEPAIPLPTDIQGLSGDV